MKASAVEERERAAINAALEKRSPPIDVDAIIFAFSVVCVFIALP